MTATNHALTGAAIATIVRQPILALPLAFISHFVCDSLPHFGINMKFNSKQMYAWLGIDGFSALLFASFLIIAGVNNPVLLAIAGFVAMSPDLAWFYYGKKGFLENKKKFDPVSKFHSSIQWFQKPSGIFIELIWAVAMTVLILKLQ